MFSFDFSSNTNKIKNKLYRTDKSFYWKLFDEIVIDCS